jgi:hypothetical protein
VSACRAVRLIVLLALAAGCDRAGHPVQPKVVVSDGRPRLPLIGDLVSSPFLARCAATPPRGGLIAQLVDESFGKDRGEAVWGDRSFGSGGGGGDRERYDTSRDYGGSFIFRKDGAERRVSAEDADAILRALKTALERELKESGVRVLEAKQTEGGKLLSGSRLEYDDPGMPTAGFIEASIALPTGERGGERMARLGLKLSETSRVDRLPGGK